MNKNFFYIANFKSYLTFNQEVNYFKNNLKELDLLAKDHNIIICPSFVSLGSVNDAFDSFRSLSMTGGVNLGAQNCSSFNLGAYTGEIPVESLAELNVKYCIVGHNERRQYFGESNEVIAKRIANLLQNNITPILCIGETQEQHKYGETLETLEGQLEIVKNIKSVLIAYEPVWAIGTGLVPKIEYIEEICNFINNLMDIKPKILYGGSVNADVAKKLKKIDKIDGFLIGKASTDFQELKKIVLS